MKVITKAPINRLSDNRTIPMVLALSNLFVRRFGEVLPEEFVREQLARSPKMQRFDNFADSITHGQELKRPSRVRLYEMLLNLLIDDCIATGGGATVRNILDRCDRLPVLIESNFPGYLEQGLFPMVVSALG